MSTSETKANGHGPNSGTVQGNDDPLKLDSVTTSERETTWAKAKRSLHIDGLSAKLHKRTHQAEANVSEKLHAEGIESAVSAGLERPAELRRSNNLHPEEIEYISLRRRRIASTGALARFLELPPGEEVHPDDVPIVGLGVVEEATDHTSFIATFQAAKQLGFWDLIFYLAGVSGACWTIGGYYTFANCNADVLLEHFASNSTVHPLSLSALRRVLDSPGGSSFIFGPLLAKVKQGMSLTLMDLYSTLSTAYMWLPASESLVVGDGLRKEWFEWPEVWERTRIKDGEEPFPIFSAIRHVRPWDMHIFRRLFRGLLRPFRHPSRKQSTDEQTTARHAWWQWFEINPLEVGCDQLEGWIPTWSYGWKFKGGRAVQSYPELSLSFILGPATSAPAAPLAIHLSTIARNLPKNFIGSALKGLVKEIMYIAPSETERFGSKHPLRSPAEPSPFFDAPKKYDCGEGFEKSARLRLMDAGLSNNMPTQPFLHPGREVDVLINCDFSSDVQLDTAMERLKAFGEERGLKLVERTRLPSLGGQARDEEGNFRALGAEECEARFAGRYAQILEGKPIYAGRWNPAPQGFHVVEDGEKGHPVLHNEHHQPQSQREMLMVYAPLLPHKVHPEFDPTTAAFSDSYNLVWTSDQVHLIAETQRANIMEALPVIRDAIREAYEKRKRHRLRHSILPFIS